MEIQKKDIFNSIAQRLQLEGFNVVSRDEERPWGGFFVIEEAQAQQFADVYFDGLDIDTLKLGGNLSPKVLIIQPEKRLSWQYHHRRAEIWQVVTGKVGLITSDTDEEGETKVCTPGTRIEIKQGERHRLIGLDDWSVVAEIWQHTDSQCSSDENEIVRVQDDFFR